MDYIESDDTVEISVEVPGFKDNDIEVELNGQQLIISGKRESRKNDEKKNYRLIERESGSFTRRINLDFDVNPKNVKADIDAGVLTVIIEKPEEKKSQKQKISLNRKTAA